MNEINAYESTLYPWQVLGMMLGLPLLQRIGLDNRQLLILAASSGALGIALWACLGLLPILQATGKRLLDSVLPGTWA